MANQPVKFRKGVSTSLPKTPTNETVGAFLLETDTGNLYVDDSSTSRVKVKDNTKLPLSGGELTGPIKFNANSLPQKTLKYITGIDGFAEGGQLGWQSKEDFLWGYSEKGHTHLYAGSTTAGGAANSATKLSTGRKISLGNAVKSTATSFDGSSDITIPINSVGEAFLNWGGKNLVEDFSPLDATLIPELGANRFAYSNPSGITVEYSRDGGTTWQDYGLTDSAKIDILTTGNSGICIGKNDSSNKDNYANYLVRLIYDTKKAGLYTQLHKFLILASINGAKNCYVTIEASKRLSPETFELLVDKQRIGGWSGYNVINVNPFTTSPPYDTNTNFYQYIRFTFGCEGVSAKGHTGLSIIKIFAYGGFGWHAPSTLAKKGTIYDFDYEKKVLFPNWIGANTPNTENPTVSQFLVTNGTDNYFRKASLAHVKKSLGIDIQSLINTLGEGTADPRDDNYYIAQDASGTNQYFLRKHSSLYNYIKSKTDKLYAPKKHNHDEYIKLSPNGTNNLIGTDNKINSVYLPTYTSSSVGLGNVTNDKQVKGLSTGTTENHIVTWGVNGYTVKDSGYTIATSVPPDARFTDTTSTLVVGSKNTSSTNEAVSSNSIYLNLFNGTTCANSHNIVGTGATTVSSDANGKITINTPSVTIPTTLPNPQTLTIKGNGTTSFTYNGSASKTLNIKSGTNVSVLSDTSGNITINATNTDTKVTSVSNHYTPEGTTTLSASGATATEITNSSNIQVLTGVTMDAKGHTTSVKSIGLKIPEIPITLPNPQTLTIQINSGAVDGTDIFTYDGSEDESINIKEGKYITVTPDGDGNITIEGNYESATSVEPGLVKLSNELGDSPDTTVTQHLVNSIVTELKGNITALNTKIDETTHSLDISDYVRCADKVIETGYVDNTYTQVIDNNKISFNQGDTTIASIHDNKIESENVIVHNSINIGDDDSGIFEILVDSTNGLIIR